MTQRTAFTVGMQAAWQKAGAVEQAFVYDFVYDFVVAAAAGVVVVAAAAVVVLVPEELGTHAK